jgi:hypothetical protein
LGRKRGLSLVRNVIPAFELYPFNCTRLIDLEMYP